MNGYHIRAEGILRCSGDIHSNQYGVLEVEGLRVEISSGRVEWICIEKVDPAMKIVLERALIAEYMKEQEQAFLNKKP